MAAEILIITAVLILFAISIAEVFVFLKNRRDKDSLLRREDDAKYKMFEIEILNELNEKIGYSLGPQNIIDLIIKFLPDITEYTCLSYILPLPEKNILRIYLKDSVTYDFVERVKEKMLDATSSLAGFGLNKKNTEDQLSGAVLREGSGDAVKSFVEIPLVISGNAAGLLAVASTKGNFFKEKDVAALKKVAQLAGQAVTRLQEVVEFENSRMNAMVASMTDGVVMTDIDYKILVANPAAKRAAGIDNNPEPSIDDFAGALEGKIDLKDRIEESVRLEKIFVSDEISLGERFFKVAVSPVKDKKDWNIFGCVVIFWDITKEKEVEKIKEDFTSMIVHELRSPLDSIKKMIEMMRVSKMQKVKQMDCLQMIYASSSDMLELVNNLLDIAKIEAGKFELTKLPSDIGEIINSRISFFDIASKDAKVVISGQTGNDLPAKVMFDPHMISEVLNNLISNAMKFNFENGFVKIQALMHKKGESVSKEAKESGVEWFIKNELKDVPDSLFIAVTNSGAGIAETEIGKLFNKFVQVKTVFAKKGGTGLGLAITKSIVESHGGIVGAESVEGRGATFYFTLPIK
jgi:signal transduction histidine kinase